MLGLTKKKKENKSSHIIRYVQVENIVTLIRFLCFFIAMCVFSPLLLSIKLQSQIFSCQSKDEQYLLKVV